MADGSWQAARAEGEEHESHRCGTGHPPFYAGAVATADAAPIGHLPVAYQRGATQEACDIRMRLAVGRPAPDWAAWAMRRWTARTWSACS